MESLDEAKKSKPQGNLAAALPALLALAQRDPKAPEPWRQAAKMALKLKQYPLAARLFEACLRNDPRNVRAAHGLGAAHFFAGAYEEADRACGLALQIDRGYLPSIVLKGHLCYMLGRAEEGRRLYDTALDREEPRHNDAAGLIMVSLARREERAWKLYDPGGFTERLPEGGAWTPPADRVWRGAVDPDATVCIYTDGGNGDIFYFDRYIRLVAERVARVFVTAEPAHDRLMESLPGLAGVVRRPEELPDALYTHIWALPGIFGPEADPVAHAVPYLAAPGSGPVLPPLSGLRVGLSWAGHPRTPIDPDRSVPSSALLAPLFELPGIDWVSLQVGHRSGEGDTLPFAARPDMRDFGDTAHVLSQLDVVITIDSAVANLAGAMALPTWVMVPTYRQFRWGLDGETTPLFPTARLFWRTHTRDWEGVIRRVAEALRAEVETREAERTA